MPTDYYLDSGGGAASSPYASWTDAAATLADIIAVPIVAGDTVWVEIGHTETATSNAIWDLLGTAAAPTKIISVTATDGGTGKTYTKATTVQLERTSNGDIQLRNNLILDGVYISAGDDFIFNTAGGKLLANNCTLGGLGNGSFITIGSNSGGNTVIFIDTELVFANQGDGINLSSACDFTWKNGPNNNSKFTQTGTIAASAVNNPSREAVVLLDGVDLSDVTTLVFSASATANWANMTIRNCLLNSGVALINSIGSAGTKVSMIECDDTGGNELYRGEWYDYYGSTVVTDTDFLNASDGTQGIAWKMVSNSNAVEFYEGHKSPWISGWIDSTGSKTFTIEVTTDNVTLQNDEIAMEVEYLSSASDTQTLMEVDKIADILATPANITSSTQTWTEPNITTSLDQKLVMTTTGTVARVGPFRARVVLYGASKTVWVDPKITVS